MGYTNSGGSRVGSVVINPTIEIQSQNGSISIEKVESESETLFNIEVDTVEESSVSNRDGSIEVQEEVLEAGNKNYNISCKNYVDEGLALKQNVLQLVTEEQNGIARSLDKKLLDKSFLNSVAIDEDSNYATSDDASTSLIVESEGYYYPVTGSTMHWLNTNNELILSRFYKSVGISGTDRTPYRWMGAAYQNGLYVISSQSNTNDGVGSCMVAYSSNGIQWTIITASGSEETWRSVQAGGGYFVICTGNKSSEFIYSTDAINWNLSASMSNDYNVGLKYRYEKWVAVGSPNRTGGSIDIQEFNDITGLPIITNITTTNFVALDFDYIAGKYIILGGSTVLAVDATTKTIISSITLENSYSKIYEVNNQLICVNNRNISISQDGTTWQELTLPFVPTTNIIYSNNKYICADAVSNLLQYSSDLQNWQSFQLPDGSDTDWNNIIDSPNGLLLLSGVQSLYSIGEKTDTAYLIDSSNYIVKNLGTWVDIPVLDTAVNSLLSVQDREFKNVQLGNYLSLLDQVLSVAYFERYTKYVNHPAISLTASAPYSQLWVNVPNDNIVDNTTQIYSDEQCTQAVGVITQHDYNINNPMEIAVSISGVPYVYNYVNSLYPQGLASMQALIDGLASIQGGGVQPSQVAGQILKTIYNAQTQQNVVSWQNEMLSGFEVFSYIDAQNTGMITNNSNAMAMLVRCNPLSDTVISDLSVLITQGAQRQFRMALYDSSLNLLGQTELQSMETEGFKTIDLPTPINVEHGESYLIGILVSGNSNGYLFMGRTITLHANNIRPYCYASPNNLGEDTFPAKFNSEIKLGETFVPYICANGGY